MSVTVRREGSYNERNSGEALTDDDDDNKMKVEQRNLCVYVGLVESESKARKSKSCHGLRRPQSQSRP